MASQKVTFNFVLPLGASDDNAPSAEIDAREDGYNANSNGKTSGFLPAETVYYLVWHPGYTIVRTHSNVGNCGLYLSTTDYRTREQLSFNTFDSREASLSKPPSGTVDFHWYGEVLGNVSNTGQKVTLKPNSQYLPTIPAQTSALAAERTRLAASAGGVLDAVYLSNPEVWRINLPNTDSLFASGGLSDVEFPVNITIFLQKI